MSTPAADPSTPHRSAPPWPWWTGGQYSLARAILGVALAAWFAATALCAAAGTVAASAPVTAPVAEAVWPAVGLALTGALAALLCAAGAGDRASALTVIAAGTLLTATRIASPGPGGVAIAGILLAHLATPPAPFGSWAARGRPDPAGGWAPGRWWWHTVWAALAIATAAAAARYPAGGRSAAGGLHGIVAIALAVAMAGAVFVPRLRPGVFLGAVILQAGRLVAAIADPQALVEPAAFLVAQIFAFDPAWVPGRRAAAPAILFYDGGCGLCHRAVRFVLAEDPQGAMFTFAPLAGPHLARILDEARRRDLPDSLVLVTGDDRVLTRAGAAWAILSALGGLWAIVAAIGRLVPRTAGDALYDAIARRRRRMFAAPGDACPLISPTQRARFILD